MFEAASSLSAGKYIILAALFLAAMAPGIAVWLERRRQALTAGYVAENATLRAKVESLSDELWEVNEQAAARHRAEAASAAKSRFLATVSHEIRTPLNGILGMADLLAETSLGGEQHAYVNAIRTSGTALASLIDEILDFSRIEAGKLELTEEPFDPTALVEGVVELLAPKAQGKGLEIAASIAPDVPAELIGDAARLRQVLINLAGNAVKFAEHGGVGVHVSRAGGKGIRFAVADTGPGVPFDRREAIFEDFEQADGSTTRRHGGSGLGLAISRRIVEHMGGELQLEATNEQGSIFSMVVPLASAERPSETADMPAKLSGRHVLLVADSPFQAPYLATYLGAAGAVVSRAGSKAEAERLLGERPAPDIVIIDCALGKTAADDLAAAAHSAGVARSLVLFSPFERRALGPSLEGFDGWLVKPVRSHSLIEHLAHRKTAGDQPVESEPEQVLELPKGFRVLLAEDNEINALLALHHLRRLGAEATHARDGLAVFAMVERAMAEPGGGFDAILMDISMPGLDGLEVTRRIRRAEVLAHRPRQFIVALTANAFEEDRRACIEAGIDVFLTKPVGLRQIAQALAGRRNASESHAA